jgi:oligoendopeptidase F
MNGRQKADRERLYELWVKGIHIRQALARNAGLDTYRDYRWQQLFRFDYTPTDCQQF